MNGVKMIKMCVVNVWQIVRNAAAWVVMSIWKVVIIV